MLYYNLLRLSKSITGKPVYRPLGSTANKTGRIAGDNITGGNLEYRGNLSTGIFKLFDNALNNNRPIITSKELKKLVDSGEKVKVVDARVSKQYDEAHVDNAVNIPHKNLRDAMETLDKDSIVVTYCNKGVTGNAAQNIFINNRYKKVYNLSGGHKFYS